MEVLGLAPLAGRRPANLSGGEKQRTALARALASEPAVVLLDEPLSSLDPQFREDVRRTLGELHAATSTTFLMVTHDFSDALTLARRAALVRQGAIEQVGGVDEVFGRPATPVAARFVGMKNLLPAGLVGGRSGLVAIRPEDAELLPPEQDADRTAGAAEREKRGPVLPCLVERVFREGFSWAVEVSCGEHKLSVRLSSEQGAAGRSLPGTRARVLLPADRLHRLPHAAENDAHATEGKNPGGGC
jgi:molybdate/tungstate transport system ATP-binding protein